MQPRERIRYLRKTILTPHLSQAEFGNKIRMSGANVGNIETGRVALTDRVISDICASYNVNEDWLRSGTGEPLKVLLPEDEFSAAAAGIAADNDILGMEIIQSYFSLDPASKKAVKNFILNLADRIRKEDESN